MECKGGTDEIGGRRRGVILPQNPTLTYNEQGTEAYVRSIIEDLTKDGNSLSIEQERLLRKMNIDIELQKVKSYILRQPFDDATGNLKEARLSTIF